MAFFALFFGIYERFVIASADLSTEIPRFLERFTSLIGLSTYFYWISAFTSFYETRKYLQSSL